MTILFDLDGVLTNNVVYFTEKGERSKGFCTRDTEALRELIANGFAVYLITSSTWPGIKNYAKRTGAEVVVTRDKMEWIEKNLTGPFIAVGDAGIDIPMLKAASAAFCPADAAYQVMQISGIKILKTKGGEGVVGEILRHVEEVDSRPDLNSLEFYFPDVDNKK